MPSFQRLPVELTEKILDELCHHFTPREPCECYFAPCECQYAKTQAAGSYISALASLNRTSKHLRELTARRLYHTPSQTKWWLLARTLITRPDLARNVKHLHLANMWLTDGATMPEEVSSHFAQQLETARAAGLACDSYTQQGLAEGNDNAAIDIMTNLCPNLKSLTCAVTYFTAFVFCQPGSMLSLETLELHHADTEMGMNLDEFFPIFRAAPNLKVLRLYTLARCDHEIPDDLSLEHVTEVELLRCCIDAEALGNILRLCPNLERLRFESGGAMVGDDQFGPREAAQMVVEYAPNLKIFHLDLVEDAQLGLNEYEEEDLEEAREELEESMGVECDFKMS